MENEVRFYLGNNDVMMRLISYLNSMKFPLDVRIRQAKKKRSLPQNNLYWAWLTEFAPHTGYTEEQLHIILRKRFLGEHILTFKGEQYLLTKSTTELTTKEFSEYMDKVHNLAETMGVMLYYPNHYGFDGR